jgi:hypothetical protein
MTLAAPGGTSARGARHPAGGTLEVSEPDPWEVAMKLTYKDGLATLLVAAVVVPYIGYLVAGQMPFIQDPRGMSATGLVLGLLAALVPGRAAFRPDVAHRLALASGVLALGLGVAALVVASSELLLALFMVALVVTWALGEFAAHRAELHTGRTMARSA